jgi:hypothetical protein
MLTIEKDTHGRGTPARPQYVVFLRYGKAPAQEMWLLAQTADAAMIEAQRRMPGETFRHAAE